MISRKMSMFPNLPFTGGHCPLQWGEPGEEKITPKTFSCLNSDQRKDLIEYFFEHESAQTSARPKPAYRFPLNQLRDYFGVDAAKDVRRTVHGSQDYKDFVAERQRSQAPPPPEMSLLSARCSPRAWRWRFYGGKIQE
jgi:hypothetical protein